MDGAASEGASMLAVASISARPAHLSGAMDRAERRGGQGDEEPGPVADRGRNVLAAEEACANEVKGIAGMEAGAGGTDGCPAVAAADKEAFAWFLPGAVAVEDLSGRAVEGGGGAGKVDGVGAAAGRGDLLYPAGELGVSGDADGIAVCFGEVTQARRAVEDSAPVSRGEVRGDGGDLPGWAAVAARLMVGGAVSVMGSLPCVVGRGAGGSADGAGAPADAAAPQPPGPGPAGSVALAERAPHARHGHGGGSLLLRCGRSR